MCAFVQKKFVVQKLGFEKGNYKQSFSIKKIMAAMEINAQFSLVFMEKR